MTTPDSCYRHHQRGAFSVIAAVMLLPLLAFMALVVDSGRLYMEKRVLQKAADTAALEAVARHGNCRPASARQAAQYVEENLRRSGVTPDDVAVWCVDIGRQDGTQLREVLSVNPDSETVQVILSRSTRSSLLQCLWGSCEITLQAMAVADRSQEAAVFTVGSQLLDLNPGGAALGPLLQGIGLNLDNTSLVGYNGLADVKITPSGLLAALGLDATADMTIGSINALMEGNGIQLGDLLDAAVRAADRSDLLGANIQLLNSLATELGLSDLNAHIPLFRDGNDNPGIFTLASTDAETAIDSALGVDVGVLNIIAGAIGIAARNHAIETGLNLNLAGLARIDLELGLIEPPSIGIGGVGTTAHTAQLRAFLRVNTQESGLLGGLLASLLGITVDLPIIIDLITGQGEITELCSADLYQDDKDHARIKITGSVAHICLGELQNPSDLFSKKNACDRPELYKPGHQFIDALGLVKLRRQLISLDALPLAEDHMTLADGETGSTGNELALGDTLANLLDTLISLLFSQATSSGDGSQAPQALAQELWDSSSPVCGETTANCHRQRINAINDGLSNDPHLGLVSELLEGLLDLVGNLLGGILGGNGCTANAGLLGLGGVSEMRCVEMLAQELHKTTSATEFGGTTQTNNALAALLRTVSGLLAPILNAVGHLLTELLEDTLGLRLGVVDVHLQELGCGGEPRLLL